MSYIIECNKKHVSKEDKDKKFYVTNNPMRLEHNIEYSPHKIDAYKFPKLNKCKIIRDDILKTSRNVKIINIH